MNKITDYTIIQRDPNGYGKGYINGIIKDKVKPALFYVRVSREDDNSTVIPWQKCDTSDGEWKTELLIPEGGLYRIEVRQAGRDESEHYNSYDWGQLVYIAHHVGIGDIYILAGQSNMSGYGRDFAYDPPQPGIHLYDNAGNWVLASHPLNSVPEPVYLNNDENSGSSPAISFARILQKRLNVPIGLVSAAKGGSSIESWNPAEKDCYLYKEMLRKVEAVGKFKGMLWYQGCNETVYTDDAEAYLINFTNTVRLWREEFGHFPIITCQLNRNAWKEEDRDRNWGLVREAQRQAAMIIKDVFIIPTMDMMINDGIHNTSSACVAIGERLALTALKGIYDLPGRFAPNIISAKKTDEYTVFLKIENIGVLKTMDDNACGMNIEDEFGLTDCVKVLGTEGGAYVKTGRPIGKNAVFHAYWKREEPSSFIRDIFGMPVLACYGLKIE